MGAISMVLVASFNVLEYDITATPTFPPMSMAEIFAGE
jgi:hypothetical protein